MASRPEEEQREAAQAEEKAIENVQGKTGEIMHGIQSGWEPALQGFTSKRPADEAAWQAFLDSQTPEVIGEIHQELQDAIEAEIDAETDATAQRRLAESMVDQFAISPGSHMYDPLVDSDRRKRIEADLVPLDIADMIFTGYVRQEVPLGNRIVLTLRSISTTHGLWIEWYIGKEAEDSSIQHARHMLGLLQLAAGLDKVNGKPTGPDLTKFAEESQRDMFIEAMKQRMAFIGRMPQEITNDFIVQNIWFSGRIRKCLSGNQMEKVGNS